ncbi:hypothetical protein EW145_g1920 [Phellinidium pouzarii]|uniref:Major facilitator superfamily (MFS) profile domain-containing protein n=1 Tax=Phellinidium pouzarii TaxID=167371 RepID=A0A4S4LD77_9AGAM|nr:hypothetical protein EW145_g1920 [Phellinidium pouzarii]
MGFIMSPFISPFAFGFLVARARHVLDLALTAIYGALVLVLIAFFMEETLYDRNLKDLPPRQTSGLRYRVETLVGITGVRMSKYRDSWKNAVFAPFKIIWRPHLLSILLFEAMVFGFSIGINTTNAVFLGSPPPVGFGFSQFGIAGSYGTPIVAIIIGELIGRYVNEWFMNMGIKRNKGVFEAETRLWACYIAMPLYLCGFLVLGASFQKKLSVGAVVMGWGLAEVAVMVNTVAVYAYCNDCFPRYKGEISALINLARTLGGFSVAYFQVPWASRNGALQTFGVEVAVIIALFIFIIPWLQIKGKSLRVRKRETRAHAAAATTLEYGYKHTRKAARHGKRQQKLVQVKQRIDWRVQKVRSRVRGSSRLRRLSGSMDARREMHQLLGVRYVGESADRHMTSLVSLEQARQRMDIVRRPELFELQDSKGNKKNKTGPVGGPARSEELTSIARTVVKISESAL